MNTKFNKKRGEREKSKKIWKTHQNFNNNIINIVGKIKMR